MERPTKVPVFESEEAQEIELIKTKLDSAGIESSVENSYMTFTTTPTATTLKLMVDLENEAKAFDIIDDFLK